MPLRWALYLDAKSKSPALGYAEFLERTVHAVAREAGMRVINMTTSFIKEDLAKLELEEFEDEGGISVCALLSTSHCTLHAWPNRGEVMFDLVSCRRFDLVKVDKLLRRELEVTEETYHAGAAAGDPDGYAVALFDHGMEQSEGQACQ